ncbi:hypothetical protein ACFL96_12785, partial [Thermoproteota archaeon]
ITMTPEAEHDLQSYIELEEAMRRRYGMYVELPAYGVVRQRGRRKEMHRIILPETDRILAFKGNMTDIGMTGMAALHGVLEHDGKAFLVSSNDGIYLSTTYQKTRSDRPRQDRFNIREILLGNIKLAKLIDQESLTRLPVGSRTNGEITAILDGGMEIPLRRDWDAFVGSDTSPTTQTFDSRVLSQIDDDEECLVDLHTHPNRATWGRDIIGRLEAVRGELRRLRRLPEFESLFETLNRTLELAQPLPSDRDAKYYSSEFCIPRALLHTQYVGIMGISPLDGHRIFMVWPRHVFFQNRIQELLAFTLFTESTFNRWIDLIEYSLKSAMQYTPSKDYDEARLLCTDEPVEEMQRYYDTKLRDMDHLLSKLALQVETSVASSSPLNDALVDLGTALPAVEQRQSSPLTLSASRTALPVGEQRQSSPLNDALVDLGTALPAVEQRQSSPLETRGRVGKITMTPEAEHDLQRYIELEEAMRKQYGMYVELPAYGVVRQRGRRREMYRIILPEMDRILVFKHNLSGMSGLEKVLLYNGEALLVKKEDGIRLCVTYQTPHSQRFREDYGKIRQMLVGRIRLARLIDPAFLHESKTNTAIETMLDEGIDIPLRKDWEALAAPTGCMGTKDFYLRALAQIGTDECLVDLHTHSNKVNWGRQLILKRIEEICAELRRLGIHRKLSELEQVFRRLERTLELAQPLPSEGDSRYYWLSEFTMTGGLSNEHYDVDPESRIRYVGIMGISPLDGHRILMVWPRHVFFQEKIGELCKFESYLSRDYAYRNWLDLIEYLLKKNNRYRSTAGYKEENLLLSLWKTPEAVQESIDTELQDREFLLSKLALQVETGVVATLSSPITKERARLLAARLSEVYCFVEEELIEDWEVYDLFESLVRADAEHEYPYDWPGVGSWAMETLEMFPELLAPPRDLSVNGREPVQDLVFTSAGEGIIFSGCGRSRSGRSGKGSLIKSLFDADGTGSLVLGSQENVTVMYVGGRRFAATHFNPQHWYAQAEAKGLLRARAFSATDEDPEDYIEVPARFGVGELRAKVNLYPTRSFMPGTYRIDSRRVRGLLYIEIEHNFRIGPLDVDTLREGFRSLAEDLLTDHLRSIVNASSPVEIPHFVRDDLPEFRREQISSPAYRQSDEFTLQWIMAHAQAPRESRNWPTTKIWEFNPAEEWSLIVKSWGLERLVPLVPGRPYAFDTSAIRNNATRTFFDWGFVLIFRVFEDRNALLALPKVMHGNLEDKTPTHMRDEVLRLRNQGVTACMDIAILFERTIQENPYECNQLTLLNDEGIELQGAGILYGDPSTFDARRAELDDPRRPLDAIARLDLPIILIPRSDDALQHAIVWRQMIDEYFSVRRFGGDQSLKFVEKEPGLFLPEPEDASSPAEKAKEEKTRYEAGIDTTKESMVQILGHRKTRRRVERGVLGSPDFTGMQLGTIRIFEALEEKGLLRFVSKVDNVRRFGLTREGRQLPQVPPQRQKFKTLNVITPTPDFELVSRLTYYFPGLKEVVFIDPLSSERLFAWRQERFKLFRSIREWFKPVTVVDKTKFRAGSMITGKDISIRIAHTGHLGRQNMELAKEPSLWLVHGISDSFKDPSFCANVMRQMAIGDYLFITRAYVYKDFLSIRDNGMERLNGEHFYMRNARFMPTNVSYEVASMSRRSFLFVDKGWAAYEKVREAEEGVLEAYCQGMAIDYGPGVVVPTPRESSGDGARDYLLWCFPEDYGLTSSDLVVSAASGDEDQDLAVSEAVSDLEDDDEEGDVDSQVGDPGEPGQLDIEGMGFQELGSEEPESEESLNLEGLIDEGQSAESMAELAIVAMEEGQFEEAMRIVILLTSSQDDYALWKELTISDQRRVSRLLRTLKERRNSSSSPAKKKGKKKDKATAEAEEQEAASRALERLTRMKAWILGRPSIRQAADRGKLTNKPMFGSLPQIPDSFREFKKAGFLRLLREVSGIPNEYGLTTLGSRVPRGIGQSEAFEVLNVITETPNFELVVMLLYLFPWLQEVVFIDPEFVSTNSVPWSAARLFTWQEDGAELVRGLGEWFKPVEKIDETLFQVGSLMTDLDLCISIANGNHSRKRQVKLAAQPSIWIVNGSGAALKTPRFYANIITQIGVGDYLFIKDAFVRIGLLDKEGSGMRRLKSSDFALGQPIVDLVPVTHENDTSCNRLKFLHEGWLIYRKVKQTERGIFNGDLATDDELQGGLVTPIVSGSRGSGGSFSLDYDLEEDADFGVVAQRHMVEQPYAEGSVGDFDDSVEPDELDTEGLIVTQLEPDAKDLADGGPDARDVINDAYIMMQHGRVSEASQAIAPLVAEEVELSGSDKHKVRLILAKARESTSSPVSPMSRSHKVSRRARSLSAEFSDKDVVMLVGFKRSFKTPLEILAAVPITISMYFVLRFKGYRVIIHEDATSYDLWTAVANPTIKHLILLGHGSLHSWKSINGSIYEKQLRKWKKVIKRRSGHFVKKEDLISFSCGGSQEGDSGIFGESIARRVGLLPWTATITQLFYFTLRNPFLYSSRDLLRDKNTILKHFNFWNYIRTELYALCFLIMFVSAMCTPAILMHGFNSRDCLEGFVTIVTIWLANWLSGRIMSRKDFLINLKRIEEGRGKVRTQTDNIDIALQELSRFNWGRAVIIAAFLYSILSPLSVHIVIIVPVAVVLLIVLHIRFNIYYKGYGILYAFDYYDEDIEFTSHNRVVRLWRLIVVFDHMRFIVEMLRAKGVTSKNTIGPIMDSYVSKVPVVATDRNVRRDMKKIVRKKKESGLIVEELQEFLDAIRLPESRSSSPTQNTRSRLSFLGVFDRFNELFEKEIRSTWLRNLFYPGYESLVALERVDATIISARREVFSLYRGFSFNGHGGSDGHVLVTGDPGEPLGDVIRELALANPGILSLLVLVCNRDSLTIPAVDGLKIIYPTGFVWCDMFYMPMKLKDLDPSIILSPGELEVVVEFMDLARLISEYCQGTYGPWMIASDWRVVDKNGDRPAHLPYELEGASSSLGIHVGETVPEANEVSVRGSSPASKIIKCREKEDSTLPKTGPEKEEAIAGESLKIPDASEQEKRYLMEVFELLQGVVPEDSKITHSLREQAATRIRAGPMPNIHGLLSNSDLIVDTTPGESFLDPKNRTELIITLFELSGIPTELYLKSIVSDAVNCRQQNVWDRRLALFAVVFAPLTSEKIESYGIDQELLGWCLGRILEEQDIDRASQMLLDMFAPINPQEIQACFWSLACDQMVESFESLEFKIDRAQDMERELRIQSKRKQKEPIAEDAREEPGEVPEEVVELFKEKTNDDIVEGGIDVGVIKELIVKIRSAIKNTPPKRGDAKVKELRDTLMQYQQRLQQIQSALQKKSGGKGRGSSSPLSLVSRTAYRVSRRGITRYARRATHDENASSPVAVLAAVSFYAIEGGRIELLVALAVLYSLMIVIAIFAQYYSRLSDRSKRILKYASVIELILFVLIANNLIGLLEFVGFIKEILFIVGYACIIIPFGAFLGAIISLILGTLLGRRRDAMTDTLGFTLLFFTPWFIYLVEKFVLKMDPFSTEVILLGIYAEALVFQIELREIKSFFGKDEPPFGNSSSSSPISSILTYAFVGGFIWYLILLRKVDLSHILPKSSCGGYQEFSSEHTQAALDLLQKYSPYLYKYAIESKAKFFTFSDESAEGTYSFDGGRPTVGVRREFIPESGMFIEAAVSKSNLMHTALPLIAHELGHCIFAKRLPFLYSIMFVTYMGLLYVPLAMVVFALITWNLSIAYHVSAVAVLLGIMSYLMSEGIANIFRYIVVKRMTADIFTFRIGHLIKRVNTYSYLIINAIYFMTFISILALLNLYKIYVYLQEMPTSIFLIGIFIATIVNARYLTRNVKQQLQDKIDTASSPLIADGLNSVQFGTSRRQAGKAITASSPSNSDSEQKNLRTASPKRELRLSSPARDDEEEIFYQLGEHLKAVGIDGEYQEVIFNRLWEGDSRIARARGFVENNAGEICKQLITFLRGNYAGTSDLSIREKIARTFSSLLYSPECPARMLTNFLSLLEALKYGPEIKEFLGVGSIDCLDYTFKKNERQQEHLEMGAVVHITLSSDMGDKRVFAKMRHSTGTIEDRIAFHEEEIGNKVEVIDRCPRGDWVKVRGLEFEGCVFEEMLHRHNPTNTEFELTMAAARAGILPPSCIIADALVIRDIHDIDEDAIALQGLSRNRVWYEHVQRYKEHYARQLGIVYGLLNRFLGILHHDVIGTHVYLLKSGAVYLIDLSIWGNSDNGIARLSTWLSERPHLLEEEGGIIPESDLRWVIQLRYELSLDWALGSPESLESYETWIREGFDSDASPLLDCVPTSSSSPASPLKAEGEASESRRKARFDEPSAIHEARRAADSSPADAAGQASLDASEISVLEQRGRAYLRIRVSIYVGMALVSGSIETVSISPIRSLPEFLHEKVGAYAVLMAAKTDNELTDPYVYFLIALSENKRARNVYAVLKDGSLGMSACSLELLGEFPGFSLVSVLKEAFADADAIREQQRSVEKDNSAHLTDWFSKSEFAVPLGTDQSLIECGMRYPTFSHLVGRLKDGLVLLDPHDYLFICYPNPHGNNGTEERTSLSTLLMAKQELVSYLVQMFLEERQSRMFPAVRSSEDDAESSVTHSTRGIFGLERVIAYNPLATTGNHCGFIGTISHEMTHLFLL